MLSKNSLAIVVAVIVDEEEADVPSKDAAIDEGPAEERGFWISGWWDASRGCTIPDINCKRAAILFASLYDISGWNEMKSRMKLRMYSLAEDPLQPQRSGVNLSQTLYLFHRLIHTAVNTIKNIQPATSRQNSN